MLYDFRKTDILKHSVIKYAKPLNFNKRQSPRPLFNVVSHFSLGLICFGLNNIDWGGGRGRVAVLYVKNCDDPLTS
jgi:hypothetical protein